MPTSSGSELSESPGTFPISYADIPSFDGTVKDYPDYRLKINWHWNSCPERSRSQLVGKLVVKLSGEAWEVIKHEDSKTFSDADGLQRFLRIMDRSFDWQPETILQESITSYWDMDPWHSGK